MKEPIEQKHFRDVDGQVKSILSVTEGISFLENPLDFFILLARYKFAARFIKKTDHVLDAGCGHGHGSIFLRQFGAKVTGSDFDSELVRKRQQEYKDVSNINFTELNLLDVSNHKTQYDVVVSMDVIEHFSKSDTEIVAKNYAALTKDTGFAVIGTPNIASAPYASARRKALHIHEFTPQEFEELLSRNFKRVFLFSMTDEVVSTGFSKMAWYLMALCVK